MAKKWYVIHTYSGYENKVKANLEHRISSMEMEDKIFDVVIPTEEVVEIKGGKKTITERKVFPGYIMVQMELDDDSWYVVRNTPGVTGFVGSNAKPIPLSEQEVDRILQRPVFEKPKPKVEFEEGETVKVVAGPLADFTGTIAEVNVDQSKVKVMVSIFGRETPAELNFDQVAKL
ncbi:MAG: transcription termination/antitermination protein NusG [Actinomycetota bacterium]|nr:transcription termination/antitermination protein NusG [Actinomycetota bacterium]